MNCTVKEQEMCQVEKRGCEGCYYNKKNKRRGKMENKIDFKEFETLVKKIDRTKYHVSRELSFSPEGAYISNWSIFRKDMPSAEYFSKDNTAVLSSAKGHTIEDIKEFMKKINGGE